MQKPIVHPITLNSFLLARLRIANTFLLIFRGRSYVHLIKKNIQIAFRYLDKKTHYSSIKTTEQTKAMYYLSIDESISIEERAGFDRVVSFNFSGKLIDASDFSEKFSFKSIAIAIHDINQQNKDLANYLFSRLYFN